jgi:glycosyltransferase involved in cell wall biosynthesis
LRITHTVAALRPHTGGPATSVPLLCRALADRGHTVTLLTASGPTSPSVESVRGQVAIVPVRSGPYWAADASLDWIRQGLRAASEAEVVHSHGVWLFPNWMVPAACRLKRRPLVVSPRGMLSPWARRQSRVRKGLAWSLADRWALRTARVLHATSDLEAEEMRAMGLRGPFAVIANGIDLDGEFAGDRLAAFARAPATAGGDRRVVFLSRIHPKKGLDLLLEAWRRLGEARTGYRLTIAGPGEPADVAGLERQLVALGDGGVEYVGPVFGDDRIRLLLDADLLVLPSHSENYGMVVAEALACGRPVVTTTGTPWSSLGRDDCGWWVDPQSEALAGALREALSAPVARLREMGMNGRRLVEREHSLRSTAGRMEAVYEWACGLRTRPEWVAP